MNLTIRTGHKKDLHAIFNLLSEANLPISDLQNPEIEFLVGEIDKKIIGVIGLENLGTIGLLRSFAVTSEIRNQKIGESLINQLFDNCKNKGIEELLLLTTDAELYFIKFDFEYVSRNQVPKSIRQTKEFSNICPASAKLMFKNLKANKSVI